MHPKCNCKDVNQCDTWCQAKEAFTRDSYDYTKLPMNPNPNLPNWMNGSLGTPEQTANMLESDMFDLATYPISPIQGAQVAKEAARIAANLVALELKKVKKYWQDDVISPDEYWEKVARELD